MYTPYAGAAGMSYQLRDAYTIYSPASNAYGVFISQLIRHSSSTCIWCIYLSVDAIFHNLLLLSWIPSYWVAANKEANEARVPSG
jgi:hypothetical protein